MKVAEFTNTTENVIQCSKERGGCGRTFGTHDDFADHECSPNSTPALSMAVAHGLAISGRTAFCKCGAWDCRTNEVADSDIRRTLQSQYSLHVKELDRGTR